VRVPVLSRHGPRIAITLLPVVLAVLHVIGVLPMGVLHRLDHLIYDARLRASMPGTLDERIVIVDIDEQSLAEVGRWPWPRQHVARLVDTLFDEQQIALLGFDTVFAEPDDSSGLRQLQQLSRGPLAHQAGFTEQVRALEPELDHDGRLAQALRHRPVVLGYYFTSDRDGRTSGQLPAAVLEAAALQGRPIPATRWNGYGANLPRLAEAAPQAGFFNAITSSDGVVRSLPLLAEHDGRYYESLALAMFRRLVGLPPVEPGFASDPLGSPGAPACSSRAPRRCAGRPRTSRPRRRPPLPSGAVLRAPHRSHHSPPARRRSGRHRCLRQRNRRNIALKALNIRRLPVGRDRRSV
jgi:adenylate cyclase